MNDAERAARKDALDEAVLECQRIAAGGYQAASCPVAWWSTEDGIAAYRYATEKCAEAIAALAHRIERTAPKVSEDDPRPQCGQGECPRPATHRFHWPGGAEAITCEGCMPFVKHRAEIMKLGLGCEVAFTEIAT